VAKRGSSATGRSVVAQLESIERDGGDGVVVFDDGRTLSVSSLDKLFFPKARLTKGDLMRYYSRVAPALLPAIADRPLSLKRYPNGAAGPSFFQQNAGENPPAGVRIEKLAVLDQGKQPRLVGGDLLTLLYTVQIGSIAVNPWHSRVGSLDSPDYAVLDLDPGPRVTWARIVDVAKLVRAELRELDLECALKTSGSRGIHLLIPLPPRTSYATSARIAELVATRVAAANPKIATVERALGKRPAGTVYVDHMQNARGKTLASVFSVRAKPDATVSAPLGARQLGSVTGVGAFTVTTVAARFGRLATLWSGAMESTNDGAAVRAAAKLRD
jgi:bifunctional non-homologous end joining protein LigD